MSAGLLALIGVLGGSCVGLVVVFCIAVLAEGEEEMGRVLPGRWGK